MTRGSDSRRRKTPHGAFFNEINPLRGFVKYAPRVKYAFGV